MKVFQQGTFRQIMSVLVSHIYVVVIGSVFGLGAMWWIIDKPVWGKVFSFFVTLFYFSVIYSKAWDTAAHDKKPYVDMQPYMLKGAVLSIGILSFSLLLWLLYKMAWTFLVIDASLATYTGVIYNVMQIFNTFMYTAFIGLEKGTMNWYAHIIIYLVPLAACTLGYIAGMKDFTIMDKLMPFVYEKRNAKNKQ